MKYSREYLEGIMYKDYILKMEGSGEGMSYLNASKHDIPSADFDVYMKWRNE